MDVLIKNHTFCMRLNIFFRFLFLFTFFGFFSCGNETKTVSDKPFGDCRFGAPKAIFSDEITKIVSHEFQLNRQTAIERVNFEDKIELELIQSGCEKPKQEFQFTLPFNSKGLTDENWIDLGIDMLAYMGNLSPSLQPFLFWEKALKEKKGQIKLGLPLELEQKHFIKLDKVPSDGTGIIIITIFQE